MLDIAPDGDEGQTSRVRLRVEQLDSTHTKGILVLHGFGSLIALAVAIATVVLLHKKVGVVWSACEISPPPPCCMHGPYLTRVGAAVQTQTSWLADRHLDDVNLVFGKHSPSIVPPCLCKGLTHCAADACVCIQALCARRRCSQLCSSSPTALST